MRIVIKAAERGEEREGGSKIIGGVVDCCMRCIEGALEMINEGAFANMAVSGDTYCKSAWSGFIITLRHLFKFFAA